jgi:hypothetical protein
MRQFEPNEPYKDGHTIGIDENGSSHIVWPDGRTELYGHIEARTNIWRPMFTLEELENLVRGGKWHEVIPAEVTPAEVAPTEVMPSEAEQAPPELQAAQAEDADAGTDVQDGR